MACGRSLLIANELEPSHATRLEEVRSAYRPDSFVE